MIQIFFEKSSEEYGWKFDFMLLECIAVVVVLQLQDIFRCVYANLAVLSSGY